jgi:hypothetical protein
MELVRSDLLTAYRSCSDSPLARTEHAVNTFVCSGEGHRVTVFEKGAVGKCLVQEAESDRRLYNEELRDLHCSANRYYYG